MIFVRSLDEAERRDLKRLVRREVGRVSERIRMILLSSRGYTVPQIAVIFECDEATVRTWIERFDADGLEGLRDRPRDHPPGDGGGARCVWLPLWLLDGGDRGGAPHPALPSGPESDHGAHPARPGLPLASPPPRPAN